MDILCTRCGEPWDVYSLTNDMTSEEANRLKRGEGCPCCYGKKPCDEEIPCDICPCYEGLRCTNNKFKVINDEGRLAQTVIAEILGDDIDGLAATLEDFGLV